LQDTQAILQLDPDTLLTQLPQFVPVKFVLQLHPPFPVIEQLFVLVPIETHDTQAILQLDPATLLVQFSQVVPVKFVFVQIQEPSV